MSSRRVTSLFLLIAAVACERFAFYSVRMSFFMNASRALTGHDRTAAIDSQAWMMMLGMLVAGGISVVANVRIPAIAGLAVMLVGSALSIADVSPTLSFATLGLGSGLFRPGVYAFAGRAFMDENDELGVYLPNLRRFARMAAFMMVVSVAIDIAAFPGGMISSTFGARFLSLLSVVALLAALALVIVSVAIDRAYLPPSSTAPINTAYRSAPGTALAPDMITRTNAIPMLLLLAGAAAILIASHSFVHYDYAYSTAWVRTVDPILGMISGAICAGIFHGASRSTSALMPVRGFGIGLAILGALRLLESASPQLTMFLQLGEAIVNPLTMIGIAYAAACTRTRFSGLIVAGFLAVQTIAQLLASSVAKIPYMGILVALVIVGIGVTIGVISRKITAGFEPKNVIPPNANAPLGQWQQ